MYRIYEVMNGINPEYYICYNNIFVNIMGYSSIENLIKSINKCTDYNINSSSMVYTIQNWCITFGYVYTEFSKEYITLDELLNDYSYYLI